MLKIPDDFDVSFVITSLDGKETLLSYHPDNGKTPYNADYVASHKEPVLVFDIKSQVAMYATFETIIY